MFSFHGLTSWFGDLIDSSLHPPQYRLSQVKTLDEGYVGGYHTPVSDGARSVFHSERFLRPEHRDLVALKDHKWGHSR